MGDKSLERKACRKLILTGETTWYIPSSAVCICIPNPSSLLGIQKVQAYTLQVLEKLKNCLYFIWEEVALSAFSKADFDFCYYRETLFQGFGSLLSPFTGSPEL